MEELDKVGAVAVRPGNKPFPPTRKPIPEGAAVVQVVDHLQPARQPP